MKRFLAALLLLCSLAFAQLDIELGRQQDAQGGAWYGLARYNLHLGQMRLLWYRPDLWLLPEVGGFLFDSGRFGLQARTQLLFDSPSFTWGADFGASNTQTPDWYYRLRIFVRFGF